MPASDHDGQHPIIPIPPATAGAQGEGRALVRGRLIDWDPATGLPTPTSRPVLTAQQVEALSSTALSLLYDPEEPDPDEFTSEKGFELAHRKWEAERAKYEGMTCGEVMMVKLAQRAAEGNHAATEELLDRVLGRPKQTSEVKSMTMKYEDYLKKMADEDSKASAMDAHIVPAPDGESNDDLELGGLL